MDRRPHPARRTARARVRWSAAVAGLAVGATLVALPGSAQAVVATTTEVVGLNQVNGFLGYTPGSTAPTSAWWLDQSRLVGTAKADMQNRTPSSGLDGSLWLQTNNTKDAVAVSTYHGAGGAVSTITAAGYQTYTDNALTVPAYEITVRCAAGSANNLRLTYDPTLFGNGAVATGTWQTWNAAAGTWWLDHTLNGNGTVSAPTSAPSGGGLQGGTGHGYTLTQVKGACAGAGNVIVGHGVSVTASATTPAADTNVDLVTFNTVTTDFLYDYAVRLWGLDRYQTAINASYNTFGDHQAGAVVLARGDLFADALSGVPLAGVYGGPLLLTPSTKLLPDVLVEIERVLKPGGKVFLMGSTLALSASVETDLKAALQVAMPGVTVSRVFGADRYGTSLAAAQQVEAADGPAGLAFGPVLVATGLDFPDGLTAGAAAFGNPASGGVVVLSAGTTLTSATLKYLQDKQKAGVKIYAVGRPAATATVGLTTGSFVGLDRYETAAKLATSSLFSSGSEYWGLATGVIFPDAMSGGAVMAHLGAPILLTLPTSLVPSTGAVLKTRHTALGFGLFFGSAAGAVSEPVAQTAFGYASGSAGALPYSAAGASLGVTTARFSPTLMLRGGAAR